MKLRLISGTPRHNFVSREITFWSTLLHNHVSTWLWWDCFGTYLHNIFFESCLCMYVFDKDLIAPDVAASSNVGFKPNFVDFTLLLFVRMTSIWHFLHVFVSMLTLTYRKPALQNWELVVTMISDIWRPIFTCTLHDTIYTNSRFLCLRRSKTQV